MNHWEQTYGSGFTICDVEEGLKKLTDHAVYNFTTDASESLDNYSLAHSTLLPDVHAGGQPRKGLGECEDIDIEVYIETFMVCLCCLPTTFAVFYSIVFVSKKILLGGTLFFAGVVTLLVSIANSEEYLLYLMCMFEAFTTVIEAILFCIVVEIFPDQVRGIALCLTVTIGRFGAVVGNFIFGLTVTTHCLFPIYMFCFLLISGSISVIFFPRLKIGH
ncbi:uncharacterized protein LOC142330529 [Lycorma delicatula]|uniref:uncharacterized protein LOC142330529 n=1 Tax=Lycorma delicatula TaxID=130591 RepID=UPI003F51085B